MWPAVIWLAVGLVLAVAEVLSGEFVLLMLGGGALVAGGAALLGIGTALSAIVFVIASVLLVFAVRPAVRRRLDRGVGVSIMHSEALVGHAAVVLATVDGHGGRVKIDGDVWSARALDHTEVIEEGARVTVIEIKGATAFVVPRD